MVANPVVAVSCAEPHFMDNWVSLYDCVQQLVVPMKDMELLLKITCCNQRGIKLPSQVGYTESSYVEHILYKLAFLKIIKCLFTIYMYL